MNQLPCGKCAGCDPILGSGEKKTKRGWCIHRSLYPHTEGPGQIFPPGVSRVGRNELAKPFIVRLEQVVEQCAQARPASVDIVEQKRKAVVSSQTNAQGERVLT